MEEQLHIEIQAWLENPLDYSRGISYLGQLCRNKVLVRNLSRGETRYNHWKLQSELQKAIGVKAITPTTPQKDPEPLPENSASLGPSPPPPFDHKAAAEKLEVALSKLHNKKGILSNSLRDFAPGDNDGRKKTLLQIDDITSSMTSIRTKLAYYEKHGQLPPLDPEGPVFEIKEKPIPDDPLLIAKMLNNERSNRSKIKARMDSITAAGDPKRLELEARLLSKENLIVELERRLHGSN